MKVKKLQHTYTVDGLINRGGGLYVGWLISGIIYLLANGWAYNYLEGEGGGLLKTRGALKWNFTVPYLDLRHVLLSS